jgi:hypothetical protein
MNVNKNGAAKKGTKINFDQRPEMAKANPIINTSTMPVVWFWNAKDRTKEDELFKWYV